MARLATTIEILTANLIVAQELEINRDPEGRNEPSNRARDPQGRARTRRRAVVDLLRGALETLK